MYNNNNNNNNNEFNARFVFMWRHRGRPFHAIMLFCRNEAMCDMHGREESIVEYVGRIRGDIVQAIDNYGGRDCWVCSLCYTSVYSGDDMIIVYVCINVERVDAMGRVGNQSYVHSYSFYLNIFVVNMRVFKIICQCNSHHVIIVWIWNIKNKAVQSCPKFRITCEGSWTTHEPAFDRYHVWTGEKWPLGSWVILDALPGNQIFP